MTSIHAFILGIVEGLTEFLPVSSTGHLVLTQELLGITQSNYLATFDIAIQVGAILAVIIMFWSRLWNIDLIKKLFVAFIPTGLVGYFIFSHIQTLLGSPLLVISTLFLGGIVIILTENWYQVQIKEIGVRSHIGYKEAFLLGVCQSLAIIPGVSRSGAMIVGGMYMKLERKALTEFTFLLAVPTMCAATLYSIYKHPEVITQATNIVPLLVGMGTAFVVALFVIKIFLDYIKTRSFAIFGYYRILLALVALFILV